MCLIDFLQETRKRVLRADIDALYAEELDEDARSHLVKEIQEFEAASNKDRIIVVFTIFAATDRSISCNWVEMLEILQSSDHVIDIVVLEFLWEDALLDSKMAWFSSSILVIMIETKRVSLDDISSLSSVFRDMVTDMDKFVCVYTDFSSLVQCLKVLRYLNLFHQDILEWVLDQKMFDDVFQVDSMHSTEFGVFLLGPDCTLHVVSAVLFLWKGDSCVRINLDNLYRVDCSDESVMCEFKSKGTHTVNHKLDNFKLQFLFNDCMSKVFVNRIQRFQYIRPPFYISTPIMSSSMEIQPVRKRARIGVSLDSEDFVLSDSRVTVNLNQKIAHDTRKIAQKISSEISFWKLLGESSDPIESSPNEGPQWLESFLESQDDIQVVRLSPRQTQSQLNTESQHTVYSEDSPKPA